MSRGAGKRFPFLSYVWDFKLMPAGRYLVLAGLVTAFLSSWSPLAPVYTVLFTLFALGFAAFVVNLCHRPRLRLSCELPDRVVAGAEVRGVARVENVGKRRALHISAAFLGMSGALRPAAEPARAGMLPKGESVTLPLAFQVLRRGVYTLPPLRAFSTFPFNLVRSGKTRVNVPSLTVLPRFHPVMEVRLPATARYQPGGVTLTTAIGESPEYVGNREFRQGDSIRRIDPRAWARLARPVVREFQEEYFLRLAVVVDTWIPRLRWAGPEGFPEMEAAVSLAATLTDALSRGEYVIDIFAAGPQLFRFRTGRNTSAFDSVLDILSCLEASRVNPFETLTPALAGEFNTVSTLVCVFLDWDLSRQAFVRMAAEAGCRVKVFLVRGRAPSLATDYIEGDGVDDLVSLTPAEVMRGGFDVL